MENEKHTIKKRRRSFRDGEPIKDLHILLSKDEHCKVKADAALAGHSISLHCKKLLFTGKVVARFSASELKAMRDLSGLSTNVNQIAKRLNVETDALTIAMAEDVICALKKILLEAQENKN